MRAGDWLQTVKVTGKTIQITRQMTQDGNLTVGGNTEGGTNARGGAGNSE